MACILAPAASLTTQRHDEAKSDDQTPPILDFTTTGETMEDELKTLKKNVVKTRRGRLFKLLFV